MGFHYYAFLSDESLLCLLTCRSGGIVTMLVTLVVGLVCLPS